MRAIIMMSSLAMGGAERNIVSVADYFVKQGVDLTLVTMNTRRDSPLAEEFSQLGISRYDLGAVRMTDTDAWARFTKFIKDNKIEIIHAQDQDTIVYAALAHRRLGIPAVMTRHVLFEPHDTMKETIRAQMVLMSARFSFNNIIAVSEAVRQDFSKRANISVNKIETIYNGLPMERFHISESKADLRRKFGWDEDVPIVLMVAVLRRGKGHDVLFKAVPQIIDAIPDVKFMMVGDGEIADQIHKQAKVFGDSMVFLGQRSDIAELLHASDVATLPSWAEALPTVLIEAGAAERPIVATDVGGAKEITIDGETGYIIQAGDSDGLAKRLIDLLQNPEKAAEMGERAHKRVMEIFTLERQAQKTISLYRRIIQS